MDKHPNNLTRFLRRLPIENKAYLLFDQHTQRVNLIKKMTDEQLEDQVLIVEDSLLGALNKNPQEALEWMIFTYPSLAFAESEGLEPIKTEYIARLEEVTKTLAYADVNLSSSVKNPDIKRATHVGDLPLISWGASVGHLHLLDHLTAQSPYPVLSMGVKSAGCFGDLPKALMLLDWIGQNHPAFENEDRYRLWESLGISYLLKPDVEIPPFSPPASWWEKTVKCQHPQKWDLCQKVLNQHSLAWDEFTAQLLKTSYTDQAPASLWKNGLEAYAKNPQNPNPLVERIHYLFSVEPNHRPNNYGRPEAVVQSLEFLFNQLPLSLRQLPETQKIQALYSLSAMDTLKKIFDPLDSTFQSRNQKANDLRLMYQGTENKGPSGPLFHFASWATQPFVRPSEQNHVSEFEFSKLHWARSIGQWAAKHETHDDYFSSFYALEACVSSLPDTPSKPTGDDLEKKNLELEVRLWQLCANRQLRRSQLKDQRFGGLDPKHNRTIKIISTLIDQGARPLWDAEDGHAFYMLSKDDHRLPEPLHVFLQRQSLQAETTQVMSIQPTRRL